MEGNEPVFELLRERGVVAVVTIEDAAVAVPLARALVAGGVRAMELTLRTGVALESMERIVGEVPEMLVGAGTVLRPEQVDRVQRVGAAFGVAPGMNASVVRTAREAGLPFAPGIATPSDIESALEFGCRVLKFFPADGLGGLSYLENIAAPYRHLGLCYIPLGGISDSNLAEYLEHPDVLAVGGSWLAPLRMIDDRDWDGIEAQAARAAGVARAEAK